jgi:hypothetical protein
MERTMADSLKLETPDGSETYVPFAPGHVYPLEYIAANLKVSLRWVKKNMLEPSDGTVPCRHFKRGNCVLIRGEWIQEWCNQELTEAAGG